MLPWRARQEAKALQISAESKANQLRIVAKGQSDALGAILAETFGADSNVELRSDIGDQFLGAQSQKRFNNICNTVIGAAQELEGVEVENHDPDPDFNARFFGDVQDVSSEKLQSIWSKVLAGEIQNPGQTSVRTLSVLKNMSQSDAVQFERLAQYVINDEFVFFDNFLINNIQHSSDLEYNDFQYLADCGLVILADLSNIITFWDERNEAILSYHPDYLVIKKTPDAQNQIPIPAQRLTTAGKELYQVANPNAHMGYLSDLSTFLHRKKCQLFVLENTQKSPHGNIKYSKRTLVEATPIRPGEAAMT